MEDSLNTITNNGELSAQSPRNPVAQLLQTFDKEWMIGFGSRLEFINVSFLRLKRLMQVKRHFWKHLQRHR
jgi:hypothetical protein